VLHALSLVGAGERGWADASVASLVQQLVDGWPSYPAAPALLARVAAAASSGGQSPVARHAYETLIARYPGTAVASTARVDLAEALVRAGDRAAARKQLKEAIAARGDATPRALLLLAQVEEQLGNRREALAAYDRVLTDYPRLERSATSVLAHARLMEAAGQPERARALLQRIVDASTGDVAAEASYRIGRILSAQGQHAAAVDWFMTAAYAADRSKWTQPSLLGAVRCFTALDRPQEALVAYRKLTATPVVAAGQSDVTPAASASPAMAERREDGTETMGDTALRLADALQRTGDRDGALEVYLSAAHLRGGPAAQRAFVGAVRNLVASGDRVFAETLYRRLAESGDADPALLAEARKALGSK
jgi:TolA-binding protein